MPGFLGNNAGSSWGKERFVRFLKNRVWLLALFGATEPTLILRRSLLRQTIKLQACRWQDSGLVFGADGDDRVG
jgi:hypothetical protein